MPKYISALTIVLMIAMVLTRAVAMKRKGTTAFHFGQIDKTDFLILPFALFYFYCIFAAAFGWPLPSTQQFFRSAAISWIGALLCVAGLVLLFWSIVSLGQSFRVGIDAKAPDELITSGAFAVSRNPIYVAFAMVLAGEFLILPNWLLLLYLLAFAVLFHRQVLREEAYLACRYGNEYQAYRKRVRRYL